MNDSAVLSATLEALSREQPQQSPAAVVNTRYCVFTHKLRHAHIHTQMMRPLILIYHGFPVTQQSTGEFRLTQ